jgi:voltage-gated potassium channel
MTLRRQLIYALLLLLVVLMIAALGYRWLGGPEVTFLDAVYMAVITVTTVGYNEVVDTSRRPALRIFNSFVILFGVGIMLYVVSSTTAFIVEGELRNLFRRRKMLKQIRDMKGHFIVCGAGETGHYVVQELLKSGYDFVVIDHDEERLAKIQPLGEFPVLAGDAADEDLLNTAGLERARGVVSVLREDRENLLVTVTVRQLNPNVRIVARCSEAKMADKLIRAGANSAVAPSMIGGMRLASELIRPRVVNFLDLMLRDQIKTMRVEEIAVQEGSPWVGKTLDNTQLHRRYDLLALALRRPNGEMQYNPHGETLLASGDVLVVLGDVNNTWKAREAAGHQIPHRAE